MENVPVRHFLNPAFVPMADFYLSLPVVGFIRGDIGNNSIALKDVIYNQDGRTVTFLNNQQGVDRFYNKLNPNTILHGSYQMNLLSFGFKRDDGFWNFSLNSRVEGNASIPRDFFKASFYGTTDIIENSFRLTKLQSDLTLFTEVALGYSERIDDRLTAGGRLKLLLGVANASNTNKSIRLNAGIGGWSLRGNGAINISSPVELDFSGDFFTYRLPDQFAGWARPSGIGAGADFGIDYRLNDNVNLSAALTDLGFIRWYGNTHNYNYSSDFSFEGVAEFTGDVTDETLEDAYNRFIIGNALLDSISTSFSQSTDANHTTNRYFTGLSSKLNLGVEYKMLDNRLGLGLLSRTQFFKMAIAQEVTLSVNARPVKWFNATVSYSALNGNFGSVGAGIGLKTGKLHWFAAADYIAFEYVHFPLDELDASLAGVEVPVPYNSKAFNLSAGVNIVFDAGNTKLRKIRYCGRCEKEKFTPNKKPLYKTGQTDTKPDSRARKAKERNKKGKGLHKSTAKDDCNCSWD